MDQGRQERKSLGQWGPGPQPPRSHPVGTEVGLQLRPRASLEVGWAEREALQAVGQASQGDHWGGEVLLSLPMEPSPQLAS